MAAAYHPRCGLCGGTHAVKRFYLSHFILLLLISIQPKHRGGPLRKAAAPAQPAFSRALCRAFGRAAANYLITRTRIIPFDRIQLLAGQIIQLIFQIYQGVSVFLFALIRHVGNVHIGGGQDGRNLADHIRYIHMRSATRFTDAHTPISQSG